MILLLICNSYGVDLQLKGTFARNVSQSFELLGANARGQHGVCGSLRLPKLFRFAPQLRIHRERYTQLTSGYLYLSIFTRRYMRVFRNG